MGFLQGLCWELPYFLSQLLAHRHSVRIHYFLSPYVLTFLTGTLRLILNPCCLQEEGSKSWGP